ncbi:glutamate racemase, partial [bacterium]|nr:glutamate racemase [bacterium]
MGDPSRYPIGVFDSGLGGLTVLRALKQALPSESFLYLGDVARLPYGTKSQAVVREYVRQCVDFLVPQPVKAVVIACNTASAMALESVEAPVPVLGVVRPGVEAGLRAAPRRAVLVLGTHATVKSEAYLRAFAEKEPGLRVEQLACPLLVPLAEEGWFDHPI